MGIVFTSTLVGFSTRQWDAGACRESLPGFHPFRLSRFALRLVGLGLDCTAEVEDSHRLALFVPGVPLINGVIDIVEGHILIGCSRLINALLLIVCIAVGLSATLMIVKNSLL